MHRLLVHPSQHPTRHFFAKPCAMALYPRLGYRRTGTAMMRKGEFAVFEKLQ